MSNLIVIPASLGSSRLPRKPFVELDGMTLLETTYRQAQKCEKPAHIIIASDDQEVIDFCSANNLPFCQTNECRNGSTRAASVAVRNARHDIVVNWQVDEPSVSPRDVDRLIAEIERGSGGIATIVGPCDDRHRVDPNSVKAITNGKNNRAIYFTRLPAPCAWHHIGVYAFDRETLIELRGLPESALAKAEKLEQLDWIDGLYGVRVIPTGDCPISINTPEDVEAWRRRYRQSGAST